MSTLKLCLVGDVIVDVMMTDPVRMRLGGVFHAARACWALKIPFEILYIAPSYLNTEILKYAASLGSLRCVQIGYVSGSPNVVVIKEATEAGAQGYEYLLRDSYVCTLDENASSKVEPGRSFLIFPGSYDLLNMLALFRGKGSISVDVANWIGKLESLTGADLSVLISSTSSSMFLDDYGGRVQRLAVAGLSIAPVVLIKENRGGTRIFRDAGVTHVGAQLRPIAHSVGVGDCFNVAFLQRMQSESDEMAGNYAARIAAEYAATTFPDEFETAAHATLAAPADIFRGDQGVRLQWEDRADVNIYIAAPDFDYMDRSHIDALANALRYHNFAPRLPIRENGQAAADSSYAQKLALFSTDMSMISECQLVVAVLLNGDPGTFIEIGLGAGMMKPTVVYDPLGLADNVMLECLPTSVCRTLDDTISAVFSIAASLRNQQ